MRKNADNQSYSSPNRAYQSSPEIKRRKNSEFTPLQKRLAAIALGLIILTGAAVKHDEIHKWVDNTILYDSVDNSITGPDMEANGLGKPDVFDVYYLENMDVLSYDDAGQPDKYLAHNGAEVDVYKVKDGQVPILDESADVRTTPLVGSPSDGTKTTIVTLKEQVKLNDVKTYYRYSFPNGYGDSFVGFEIDETQKSLPNAKLQVNDDSEMVWVNSEEVSFPEVSKK